MVKKEERWMEGEEEHWLTALRREEGRGEKVNMGETGSPGAEDEQNFGLTPDERGGR